MSKHKFIGGTVLCAAAGLTLCGEASVRLDISGETARQTVIAEGGRILPDGYQEYPTTPAVTAFASNGAMAEARFTCQMKI